MYNNYKTIHESEIEDFKSSCKEFKLDPNEFELKEHDINEYDREGLKYFNGKITISRKGKNKTYNTGNNSKWPSDFHEDLEKHYFI